MIRGEAVTVTPLVGETAGRLGGSVPVYGDPAEVANVLVVPSTSSESDYLRPEGVRVDFTLHFPRGYDTDLRGALVTVRGIPCRVVGAPSPYTEANVPGPWTMPVEVVRSDG